MELNQEQQIAVKEMQDFLNKKDERKFFLLSGPAGTGKTFTIKSLLVSITNRLVFTAPTNKATRVLLDTFNSEDLVLKFTPEVRTIYSLLGLRLEPNSEIKELTKPDNPLDLRRFLAVVVDEASMINKDLWACIKKTADTQNIKFLFMGDPAQLPPVKELYSPVWEIEDQAKLTKVMRHDNQILTLATNIRRVVDHPAPTVLLQSDHNELEGVWRVPSHIFEKMLLAEAELGNFIYPNRVKAIAWRNITVDRLNTIIRQKLYTERGDWFVDDRIILAEPAKDPIDEQILATTDSEGTIIRSSVEAHPTHSDIICYRLLVSMDEGNIINLWIPHPSSAKVYQVRLALLSAAAKGNRRLWKDFWAFKDSFHSVKYGYAITAHRSQGSTYEKVFVDCNDILTNWNRQEAFRCLYVACTRPRKQLILT